MANGGIAATARGGAPSSGEAAWRRQFQSSIRSARATLPGLGGRPGPADAAEDGTRASRSARASTGSEQRQAERQLRKAQQAAKKLSNPTTTKLGKAKAAVQLAGSIGKLSQLDVIWQYVWRAIMKLLTILFSATWEFVIPIIILGPLIFFLYLFRMVRVNLLNGGRPLAFPILGVVTFKVSPLKFPFEFLEGLAWIFGMLVIVGLIITIVLMALIALTKTCELLPFACDLVSL